MPFLEPCNALYSLKARGRVGRPMLCGWAWCGWSQCGEEIEICGVYQQRRKRAGNNANWHIGDPKPLNFFQAPTWPTNEYYAARQAWRGQFAAAVLAWQGLTAEQKAYYNANVTKKGRTGYHEFLSKYLKSI